MALLPNKSPIILMFLLKSTFDANLVFVLITKSLFESNTFGPNVVNISGFLNVISVVSNTTGPVKVDGPLDCKPLHASWVTSRPLHKPTREFPCIVPWNVELPTIVLFPFRVVSPSTTNVASPCNSPLISDLPLTIKSLFTLTLLNVELPMTFILFEIPTLPDTFTSFLT